MSDRSKTRGNFGTAVPAVVKKWTGVLAGEDGMGRDFGMVHFTGPNDMRAFFGCGRDDVTRCIDRWLTARAGGDEKPRRSIATDAARRQALLRYYALRASSEYRAAPTTSGTSLSGSTADANWASKSLLCRRSWGGWCLSPDLLTQGSQPREIT